MSDEDAPSLSDRLTRLRNHYESASAQARAISAMSAPPMKDRMHAVAESAAADAEYVRRVQVQVCETF